MGDFTGPLDITAVAAQFPLVRDTLKGLTEQLPDLNVPSELLLQTVRPRRLRSTAVFPQATAES